MENLRVKNLSFWYPEREIPSIQNIDIKINQGEFILIVGPSGCGKSTLLRILNRGNPDFSGGRVKGEVTLDSRNVREFSREEIVRRVGMVYQHPEKQIVLQNVEREIAFGLENLNIHKNKMRRNVSEMISLFGLRGIMDKQTNEISGGEKQRVALASVVAMDPDIILFDEPISQLDPISSEEVLNSIKRLNKDFGKTIILVEQRIDRCFDMADRIYFMDKGKIVGVGTPDNIPEHIEERFHIPNISYIFKQAGFKNPPINVKGGRALMNELGCKGSKSEEKYGQNHDENPHNFIRGLRKLIHREEYDKSTVSVEIRKVNFSYDTNKRTLKDINLTIGKGEVLAVMGENGAGKSTLFKVVTGLVPTFKGEVRINGNSIRDMDLKEKIKNVGYLSQNPNDYFGRTTVFEEVAYTLRNMGEYDEKRVLHVLEFMNIEHLREYNPRDLSGGEKQRVAIAATMVGNPDILIFDEPTRGMDSVAKENLGNIMRELSLKGKTIILITHDSDFAGDYSDRTILMFRGEIIVEGESEEVLFDSIYYSPQVAKLFKNVGSVVKSEEGIERLRNAYEK